MRFNTRNIDIIFSAGLLLLVAIIQFYPLDGFRDFVLPIFGAGLVLSVVSVAIVR